jgi:hypothetical protein
MLHRPPSPHRAATTARRKRRYRDRMRRGAMTVMIEIVSELVDWLVAVQWLEAGKADDRAEIASAIMRLLADAARHNAF